MGWIREKKMPDVKDENENGWICVGSSLGVPNSNVELH